jgi:hypothetical protein
VKIFIFILGFLYGGFLAPIFELETFLAGVLYLSKPSFDSFMTCVFVCGAQSSLRNWTVMRLTGDQLEALRRFIVSTIAFRFEISEISIHQYFNKAEIAEIGESVPNKLAGQRTLARVFFLSPLIVTQPLGACKGFLVQMASDASYYGAQPTGENAREQINRLSLASLSPSYVFIDAKPSDLTDVGRFRLLHELGHCTELAHRVKIIPYSTTGSFIISSIVIFGFFKLSLLTSALLVFYAFLLMLGGNPDLISAKDESAADAFAFSIFGKYKSVDKYLDYMKSG